VLDPAFQRLRRGLDRFLGPYMGGGDVRRSRPGRASRQPLTAMTKAAEKAAAPSGQRRVRHQAANAPVTSFYAQTCPVNRPGT
jgi:hypothetical protein